MYFEMNIRERILPRGWYPWEPERIAAFLGTPQAADRQALAVVAPHAGWAYSGRIAAASFRALKGPEGAVPPDTVAVLGGHLPPGTPPLFALEDAADTPLGPLEMDNELRDRLYRELDGREDRYRDNTVEVFLPLVRYFFPRARLLWVRLPAEAGSLRSGEALARAALDLGRTVLAVGSTDLTHYGDNYGFAPHGRGRAALDWVRRVNDRSFIDAVLAGNAEETLARAEGDRSACSAGAVLGALGFARARGAGRAELLAYGTSADGDPVPPPSFVGYASLAWSK
jgi:AmmeMemoRadiSam system protein B